MTTDTIAMYGLFAAMTELTRRTTDAVVPEPEFRPFALPGRKAAALRAEALAPANEPAAKDVAA